MNQVKNGAQLLTTIDSKLDKSALTATVSTTPSDDLVPSEAAVEEQLDALRGSMVLHVDEKIAVNTELTEFKLTSPPVDNVVLNVNGVNFNEGADFTVNRATRTVTWTGPFALTDDVASAVHAQYHALPKRVKYAEHIAGMVLVEEGHHEGTWARVNPDFEEVEFDPARHNTWAGMHTVTTARGEFVEIPVTYVKTEVLADGPYAGKTCYWIADYPEQGFHVHPAFMGVDGQPHALQVASYIASQDNQGLPFSVDKGQNGYWTAVNYDEITAAAATANTVDEDGYRPYNIYDHHLLARMVLTEFGTPNVKRLTVNNVRWDGAARVDYHGVHDPYGTAFIQSTDVPMYTYYCVYGLVGKNGTYNVLRNDGSGELVDTGVAIPAISLSPVNCLLTAGEGYDFSDLFIVNTGDEDMENGSFASAQNLYNGYPAMHMTCWARMENDEDQKHNPYGPFWLINVHISTKSPVFGWRLARCC